MNKLKQTAIRGGARPGSSAARLAAQVQVERVVDGEAFDYALRIEGCVEPDGSVSLESVQVVDHCEGRPPLGDLSHPEQMKAMQALADAAADERRSA